MYYVILIQSIDKQLIRRKTMNQPIPFAQRMLSTPNVSNIEIKDDSISFSYLNERTNSIDSYDVDGHMVTLVSFSGDNNVILCVDGSPKQTFYCENKEQQVELSEALTFHLHTSDDLVRCESKYGDVFLINKSKISTIIHKDFGHKHTLLVCMFGIDQNSNSSSLVQKIALNTIDEVEALKQLLK